MARRGYEQRTSVQSSGPLGLERAPSVLLPGGSGLTDLGAGVVRAGQHIQQVQIDESMTVANQQAAEAQQQMMGELDQLLVSPAATFEGAAQEFQKKWRGDLAKARSAVRTPAARDFLTEAHRRIETVADQRIGEQRQAAHLQRVADSHDRALAANEALLESNPSLLLEVAERTRVALEGAGLDQQAQAKFISRNDAALARAAVRGYRSTDPRRLIEDLQSGDPKLLAARMLSPEERQAELAQAQKQLREQTVGAFVSEVSDAYGRSMTEGNKALAALPPTLGEEDRTEIRRRVASNLNLLQDERARALQPQIVGLYEKINGDQGTRSDRDTITSLYEQGGLTPAARIGLLDKLQTSLRARAERDQDHQAFMALLGAGLPLDPANAQHRKMLDATFLQSAGKAPPGDPRWIMAAGGLTRQTKMLPPSAESWLRSAARATDPAIVGRAADFYGAIADQVPEAAARVDTDAKSMLALVSQMVKAGATPVSAYEQARKSVFEVRRDLVEERRRQWAGKKVREETRDDLVDRIDRDFDTWLTREPAASAALQADFEQQARVYFETTGDAGVARNLAWQDVKRIYGVSNVNGKPQLLPYAPEAMFPGLPVDLVRSDIARAITDQAAGVRVVGSDGALSDAVPRPEAVRLVPFEQTARTEGRVWYLGFTDEYGAPDVLRDKAGVPLAYELPVTKDAFEAAETAQFDQQRVSLEDRRVKSKERRDLLREQLMMGPAL